MKKYFSSDIINPVFLKELRQLYRGRLLGYIAAGLLAGQLCFFLIADFIFRNSGGSAAECGRIVYNLTVTVSMYLVILITAIVVPMQRFYRERQTPELDYSLVTLLTPLQIVCGKLFSGLFTVLYINLLCLPSVIWGIYSGGVEYSSAAEDYFTNFPVVILALMLGIFCGSTGKKWMQGIFILCGFQIIAPLIILRGSGLDDMQSGLLTLAIAEVAAFLFIASVAVLTPAYANRMWYPRLFLTAMYIFIPAGLSWIIKSDRLWQIAAGSHLLLTLSLFCLLTLCDRKDAGPRVMGKLPGTLPGKALYLMFSSNHAGGMVLSCILYAIFLLFLLIRNNCGNEVGIMQLYGAAAAYVLFYTQLALLLRKFTGSGHPLLWFAVAVCVLGAIPLFCAAPGLTYLQAASPFFLSGSRGFFDPKLWLIPLLTLVSAPLFFLNMLKQK